MAEWRWTTPFFNVRLPSNPRPAVYRSGEDPSTRVQRRPIFPLLRLKLSTNSSMVQVRPWAWLQHWLHQPHGGVTRDTPLEPRNILRIWHGLLEEAGIERCSFHASRHTAASLLIAEGVPMKVVQEV